MALHHIKVDDQKLPEGLYRFRVKEFTQEIDPKKGEDFFKVKLSTVSMADSKARTARDRFPLGDEMLWKLLRFLISLGYVRTDDGSIDFDDTEIAGKSGFFECSESESKKNGQTRTYTNYRYLEPDDEKLLDLPSVPEIPPDRGVMLMKCLKATIKGVQV